MRHLKKIVWLLAVLAMPGLAWGQLRSGTPLALNSTAPSDASLSDESPWLANDGAGNWVGVWTSTNDMGGTIGFDTDLLVSTSSDDGATWSAAAVLNSTAAVDGTGDANPRLETDGAGTWVVVWQSLYNLGGTIGTDNDIFSARSTDNGATWSPVVVVNSTATVDTMVDVVPTLAWTGGNNWVTTWQTEHDFGGTAGTDADIAYAYSTDGGASWSTTALLNSTATSDGTSND